MTTPNSMRYRCNCGGRLYVKETRAADDAIYRVRKCANCTYLFTTKEIAIEGTMPKHARLQNSLAREELSAFTASGAPDKPEKFRWDAYAEPSAEPAQRP
jgi:hypothetical protein